MRVGDLVRLSGYSCMAAQFCYDLELTAKIVAAEGPLLILDAGLGYTFYAAPTELELIAQHKDIPR